MITKLGEMLAKLAAIKEELNSLGIPMSRVLVLPSEPYSKHMALGDLAALDHTDLLNELEGHTAQINSRQRGKMTSDVARDKSVANGFTDAEHYAAAAGAGKAWRWAAHVGNFPDSKHGDPNTTIDRYVAPIRIADKDAYAWLTAKLGRSGRRLYSLELLNDAALRYGLDLHPEDFKINTAQHKGYDAVIARLKE